ncbi:DUF4387 family protein [Pelagibius sp.]|uniref:DUF4387 family protein n=1 Tax=Pelagibius sp. TaxID=1931238 RepID=UPI002606854C|nr:DUF4387 family protein [Pelagibius sp.]
MPRLSDLVLKVRSKNAGPFWLTIDIFCGTPEAFETVSARLSTERVAELYRAPPGDIKRFDIADLMVVKFSLPRPVVQGSREDRDMHGAGWAVLLEEAVLD